MRLKLVYILLCAVFGKSVGLLRCYSCTFSSVDSDQSCLTITDNTRSVDCPFEYCTIFRQEYIDPSGVVASFNRGCDDQPDYLNHDIVDANFRTYYRACTNDLCNIGNGIESVVGGALQPNPQFEGDNLLVPGTAGGANAVHTTLVALLFVLVMHYIV
ncbi:uncharacterized protein LOC126368996 [Pectinophora gossypiella]|uniref:uncharacterized protein LOC126368996 n=1 Tax=Pectinophora gossypiella TaxID=13191 RepID=UPI00214F23F5|nr:uncharacterized protein LOC126368996 [Pectinophora gossypiella]